MYGLSAWHGAALLVLIAVPVAILIHGARSARAEGGTMTPGFKGWLFVLAASHGLATLATGAVALRALVLPDAVLSRFPVLRWYEAAISGAAFAVALVCLVLMLRRSRRFVTAYQASAACTVASLPLGIIGSVTIMNLAYGIPLTYGHVLAAMGAEIARWVVGCLVVAALVLYVLRSRRVRMTFVA